MAADVAGQPVWVVPSPRAAKVPVWPDRWVPSRFRAVLDVPGQPYRAALDVRVTERGAEVMELGLGVRDWGGQGGIGTEGLRKVRVAELLRLAVDAATQSMGGEPQHGRSELFRMPGDPEGEWRGSYAVAPGGFPDSQPPGRGRQTPDEHLRRVAAVYREALRLAMRDPVGHVARTIPGSRSSAGRWVLQARRRGYLGPARGPTAGEADSRYDG